MCRSDSTRAELSTISRVCGTKLPPLILTAEYASILAERLPRLDEAMCQNEEFQWMSENKVFEGIAEARTELREWHSIDIGSHSNYMN